MFASQIKTLVGLDEPSRRALFSICSKDDVMQNVANFPVAINSPAAVIMNTALSKETAGEHWVLLFCNPSISSMYFFDSLGNSPHYHGIEPVFQQLPNIKAMDRIE